MSIASPKKIIGLCSLALVGAALWFFLVFVPGQRLLSQDMSVASYQISAAAEQYFVENDARIFAGYDDLIGPKGFIKGVNSVAGEDYHELFPLRRDAESLTVTMGDGRKVIVYFPPERTLNFNSFRFRQTPAGKIIETDSRYHGAALEIYQRWLDAERKPDGVFVKKFPDGRRFEITYRGGVADGPFRAYHQNGNLWGEATYAKGRPVGEHRLYDPKGKLIWQTSFPGN